MTEPSPSIRRVAAFDFDGTITERDTVVPFLRRLAGTPRVIGAVGAQAPDFVRIGLGRGDRDAAKERFVRRLLGGRPISEIDAAGTEFADALWARQAFRLSALERLAWHTTEGHEIVIVSASLDVYLRPLAPRLGVGHVIACSLETDAAGIATGGLIDGNCRGPEKVRRLREWLGDAPAEVWAYGDSSGDDELLAFADHPTRV